MQRGDLPYEDYGGLTERHISSENTMRVKAAVMYLGRIVEMGPTARIFAGPAHAYTKALLSAVPAPDPDAARTHIVLDPGSFAPRAPLRELEPGHLAAV